VPTTTTTTNLKL